MASQLAWGHIGARWSSSAPSPSSTQCSLPWILNVELEGIYVATARPSQRFLDLQNKHICNRKGQVQASETATCTHSHTCAHMHTHSHGHTHVHTHIHTRTFMYTLAHAHQPTLAHTHMCTLTSTLVCAHECTHGTLVHALLHMHSCMHTHTGPHMCTHPHISVHTPARHLCSTHLCVETCTLTHTLAPMHSHTCTCNTRKCTCLCMRTCAHSHAAPHSQHMHTCVHTHTCTCSHTCMRTHTSAKKKASILRRMTEIIAILGDMKAQGGESLLNSPDWPPQGLAALGQRTAARTHSEESLVTASVLRAGLLLGPSSAVHSRQPLAWQTCC